MSRKKFNNYLLIATFSVIAMLPAYIGGIPIANDQSQHYQFAGTVYDNIVNGNLYPSLSGETNHGFGDVGIRFYPPLTSYCLSLIYLVVRDWYFTSLIAFTLVFFFGALGVYLWLKDELGPTQALIAALIYTLAPYHLNQIYGNFLLAEFFATAIIPFCFLFLTRVCRDGRWINVVGLTATYALLILTHLPMTILCSLAMGMYTVFLLTKNGLVGTVLKLLLAVVSALVLTVFYWSRWMPELELIKHSTSKYFSATWDYSTNFLLRPSHFIDAANDSSALWFADTLLIVTLLIMVPTAIYLICKRLEISRFLIATTAILIVSILMTTPVTSVIWDHVSFLQKLQFPSRWLVIVSLFGSGFAAIGIAKAAAMVNEGKNILATIGLGAVLTIFFFAAVFVPKSAAYRSRDALNSEMASLVNSEACECWWPIWADRSAFSMPDRISAMDRNTRIALWSATEKRFKIGAGDAGRATVNTFYYPRWQATVNGAVTPVDIGPSGTISLPVPAETADVDLIFREPPYVRVANIASISAWGILLAFTRILLLKSRKTSES